MSLIGLIVCELRLRSSMRRLALLCNSRLSAVLSIERFCANVTADQGSVPAVSAKMLFV